VPFPETFTHPAKGPGATDTTQLPSEEAMAIDRAAVIDRDAALKRLGGDESLFRAMVRFFDEDSPGLLEDIRSGIRSSDSEQVARAAHTLKGLAANFNAEAAAGTAARMQEIGQSGDLSPAEAALSELEAELSRLYRALGPYRSN
jgi:HPt (histidine-containing phosphotransfer) domain-containing protein